MAETSEKIIKLKHESEFTVIGNSALQDKSLSWAARGLLAYMLSLPPDWNIHENELLAHTTDKKLATHGAMEELIRAGYVFKWQGKDFRNETCFFVSDSKTTKSLVENQISLSENQPRLIRKSDKPLSENQPRGLSENQQLQNTYIQRNNKKIQRKEGGEKAPPPENDILKTRIDSLREYWNSLGLPKTPRTTNQYAIGDLKDSLNFYSDKQIKEAMKNYATLLDSEFFEESSLPGGDTCKTYKNFIQRWVHNFTEDGLKNSRYEYFFPEEGKS
jgi:hypothetical protein